METQLSRGQCKVFSFELMERFHCVGLMVAALNLGEASPQYIPLIVAIVSVAVGLTFADWVLKKWPQWVGVR